MKPKIVWGQFQDSAEYAFAEHGIFLSNNEYMLLCPNCDEKCLRAFLNSKAMAWLLSKIIGSLGGNAKIGQKSNFIKLSVLILSAQAQSYYASLVDSIIMEMQNGNPIEMIEKRLNSSIYELFCLDANEIRIIENQEF